MMLKTAIRGSTTNDPYPKHRGAANCSKASADRDGGPNLAVASEESACKPARQGLLSPIG